MIQSQAILEIGNIIFIDLNS